MKKPVFLAGNANWTSELPSVVKQCNIKIHSSIKLTPIQDSRLSNEILVYSNLRDNRNVRKPKYIIGQIVRTADIKRVFSKGDNTNYKHKLYTITENIHNTIPS